MPQTKTTPNFKFFILLSTAIQYIQAQNSNSDIDIDPSFRSNIDNNEAPTGTEAPLDSGSYSNRALEGSFVATMLIIVAVVLVLIGLALMGYFYYNKHHHAVRGVHEEEEI